jgi:hypothetical protein
VIFRAGLAAAAVCAIVLACEAAAPEPDRRPPAAASGEKAAPGRRGDRHARAAVRGGDRPLHELTGTVVRAEDGRVVIRPRSGREVTLRIGPRTTLTTPRGDGAKRALAPGDEVRASWRAGGDPPTALSVEVQAGPPAWTDQG